jgi:hypothetical protein
MAPSSPRVCVAVSPRLLADVLLRALAGSNLDVSEAGGDVGDAFAVAVGTPDLVGSVTATSSIELPGSQDGIGDVIVHDLGGDRSLAIGSLAELRDLVVILAQH